MNFLANVSLLLMLIMTAAGAVLVKDLIGAVLILGSYSFFLALIWAWLGAVDVAFTEAVVGAGVRLLYPDLRTREIRERPAQGHWEGYAEGRERPTPAG